jgi:hypothetical protein
VIILIDGPRRKIRKLHQIGARTNRSDLVFRQIRTRTRTSATNVRHATITLRDSPCASGRSANGLRGEHCDGGVKWTNRGINIADFLFVYLLPPNSRIAASPRTLASPAALRAATRASLSVSNACTRAVTCRGDLRGLNPSSAGRK